jgi:transcriptional regulator of NAD metabolism
MTKFPSEETLEVVKTLYSVCDNCGEYKICNELTTGEIVCDSCILDGVEDG